MMQNPYTPYLVGLMMMTTIGLGVNAAQAQSGSLEPPGSAVDGGGDPAPTTQTQPSWDQTLPAAERFVLVMGGAAVLDKNTGLVWEQSPPTTTHTWSAARFQCTNRTVGGQKAWRLPSVHELASLVDPGNPGGNPDLPAGHPFSNVQAASYWSAMSNADNPAGAWSMNFFGGIGSTSSKNVNRRAWCVRGGQNHGSVY